MTDTTETVRNPLEPMWTPKQVSTYLQVHPRTVYNWLSLGRVFRPEVIVRIGKRVRIPRSEVERIAGNIKKSLGAPESL